MIQRIMYAVMLAVGLTFVFGAGNVFTCVELLAGIESIVGENSVFYVNPYSYYYTNPDAILALYFKSILFGILCIVVAVWIKFYFRIKLKFSLCGLAVLVAGIVFCCTDILIWPNHSTFFEQTLFPAECFVRYENQNYLTAFGRQYVAFSIIICMLFGTLLSSIAILKTCKK